MKPATRGGRAHSLHVPLPDATHRRLREEAERSGQPATVLAREAIDRWLDERQRAAVHDAVAEHARAAAGSADDLDVDLEDAGVEVLLGTDPNVRKRRRR